MANRKTLRSNKSNHMRQTEGKSTQHTNSSPVKIKEKNMAIQDGK